MWRALMAAVAATMQHLSHSPCNSAMTCTAGAAQLPAGTDVR